MDIRLSKKRDIPTPAQVQSPGKKKPNMVYIIGFVLILLFALILAVTKPRKDTSPLESVTTGTASNQSL